MTPPPVRVLLHPSAASPYWRRRLDEHPDLETRCVADPADCLDLVTRRRVEVIIVDPCSDDGGHMLALLRSVHDLPVVALAEDGEPAHRAGLLDAGATILLDRTLTDLELGAQLRAVRARPPGGQTPFRLHAETMEVERDGERISLTETEWKLFSVLAAAPGRHFTAADLMERVWGHTVGPTSTVSVHLHRLRQKLERDPESPDLLRTVRGRGYALVLDAEQS